HIAPAATVRIVGDAHLDRGVDDGVAAGEPGHEGGIGVVEHPPGHAVDVAAPGVDGHHPPDVIAGRRQPRSQSASPARRGTDDRTHAVARLGPLAAGPGGLLPVARGANHARLPPHSTPLLPYGGIVRPTPRLRSYPARGSADE